MTRDEIINFVNTKIITKRIASSKQGENIKIEVNWDETGLFIELHKELQRFKRNSVNDSDYPSLQIELKKLFIDVISKTIQPMTTSLGQTIVLVCHLDYLELLDIPALSALNIESLQDDWSTTLSILNLRYLKPEDTDSSKRIFEYNPKAKILSKFVLIQALYIGHFELVKYLVAMDSELIKTGYHGFYGHTSLLARGDFSEFNFSEGIIAQDHVSYPYVAAVLGYGDQESMLDFVVDNGGLVPFDFNSKRYCRLEHLANAFFASYDNRKNANYIKYCIFSLSRVLKNPANNFPNLSAWDSLTRSDWPYYQKANIVNFLFFAGLELFNPARNFSKTIIDIPLKLVNSIQGVDYAGVSPILADRGSICQITPEILFTVFKQILENENSDYHHRELQNGITRYIESSYQETAKHLLKLARTSIEIVNQLPISSSACDEHPTTLMARFTYYLGIRAYPISFAQLKSTTFPNIDLKSVDEADALFTENISNLNYYIDKYQKGLLLLVADRNVEMIGCLLDVVANHGVDFDTKIKVLDILDKAAELNIDEYSADPIGRLIISTNKANHKIQTSGMQSLVSEIKLLKEEITLLKQQLNTYSCSSRFFTTVSNTSTSENTLSSDQPYKMQGCTASESKD